MNSAQPGTLSTSRLTRAWLFRGALGIVLICGIFLRLLSWPAWPILDAPATETPRPLLGNADGYFYLGLARDLLEDRYHADSPRVFPEQPPRPEPVPLLSLITAGLTRLTGLPLELIAALLPAVLGALIALPVALIARPLAGRLVAIVAAGLAVLMPYFAQRSALGWHDTDALNVILPFGMAAIAMALLHRLPGGRAIAALLALYALLVGLLLRWWDQTPEVVALLSAYPLLLILAWRWSDRHCRYGSLGVLAWLAALLPIDPHDLVSRVARVFHYVTEQSGGVFSPTAIAIGEQQAWGFAVSARMAAGSGIMLVLALAGLGYLGRRRPVILLPLVPLIVLGVLGLVQAERFLIFLAPVIALGLAGILAFVRAHLSPPWAIPAVAALSLAIAAALVLARDGHATPIIPKTVVERMRTIPRLLPEDAVLWNLCDYGYALSYWGRRPTTCDGASHSGARRTFMAAPLYADSPPQAARFVHFFVAHGSSGMQRILDRHASHWPRAQAFLKTIHQLSPDAARAWLATHWEGMSEAELDDWIRFLFPPETRPVYLVLDRQTMRNTHWWFWFSSWDPERRLGLHPNYILFPKLPAPGDDGRILDPDGLFAIDSRAGIVQFRGRTVELRRLNRVNRTHQESQGFDHPGHWILDIATADGYGVLHDPLTHHKVGHQLYMQTMDNPLFEPISLAGAEFQLWRVHHPD